MKLPEDRVCPNGWICEDCNYERSCRPSHYHIETDLEVVIRAAEISERAVNTEVVESVEKCRGTWYDKFSKMTEEERWSEYRLHHIGDLQFKEPVKAMSGPTSPGGGKVGKIKKSNKGTKIVMEPWTSNV